MKKYFSKLYFSRHAGILLMMFGFFVGMYSKNWFIILIFPISGLSAYWLDEKLKIKK